MSIETSTVHRLELPAAVNRRRIVWPYAIAIGSYHTIALLALLPWLFSWTGAILSIVGTYLFGCLGINLCYHRILTHRGMVCPKWLEYSFATLGVCCLQDTPARWIAVHRRHHEHSDKQDDPHSPRVNFLWGHIGWMLLDNRDLYRLGIFDRYAKDILRDPFYRRLEKPILYAGIIVASWYVFFLGGFLASLATGASWGEAAQFGLSLLIWGVFVRTVLVWHITWSVNSLSHLWGYRTYATADDSRNNWFVALLTSGEGWHNNHHADPRSASHGHGGWEIDLIYLFVRGLEKLGLAKDVRRPRTRAALISSYTPRRP